jgi:hypothetical protein
MQAKAGRLQCCGFWSACARGGVGYSVLTMTEQERLSLADLAAASRAWVSCSSVRDATARKSTCGRQETTEKMGWRSRARPPGSQPMK